MTSARPMTSHPPLRSATGRIVDARRATRVAGFTLVELLVVIAIIGTLSSLLLPALSRAKDTARTTVCLNHSRQLTAAWLMYSDDFDHLPSNVEDSLRNAIPTNWVAGSMARSEEANNPRLLVDPAKSLLAPYFKEAKLLKCPSDRSRFARSMAMNCRMNPIRHAGPPRWIGGIGTNYSTYLRDPQIRNPSLVFVFIDERSDTINDAYFGVDLSNTGSAEGVGRQRPYYVIDYPASYHRSASSVSFADGHAVAHRWMEATTTPPLGAARPGTHTSKDDPDMRWLQDHTSERSE